MGSGSGRAVRGSASGRWSAAGRTCCFHRLAGSPWALAPRVPRPATGPPTHPPPLPRPRQELSAEFPRADAVVHLAALAHYNLQVPACLAQCWSLGPLAPWPRPAAGPPRPAAPPPGPSSPPWLLRDTVTRRRSCLGGFIHSPLPSPPLLALSRPATQNFDEAQELFEELLQRDPHRIEVGRGWAAGGGAAGGGAAGGWAAGGGAGWPAGESSWGRAGACLLARPSPPCLPSQGVDMHSDPTSCSPLPRCRAWASAPKVSQSPAPAAVPCAHPALLCLALPIQRRAWTSAPTSLTCARAGAS